MKADPRGKRKLTVEEWHDVFNKSDAGGYVKLTYGTILEFEDSVRRAALASQLSGEGGATVPSERDKRYAPSLEQEAGATPSGPTINERGVRAKLEALRDKVANGIVSSQMREISGDYESGATDVEIAVEAALTAIIKGKD